MKILLSPSKTRNIKSDNLIKKDFTIPLFIKEANYIADQIKEIDIGNLGRIMKIKKELLDSTFENYSNFENLEELPAIHSYSGVVFNEIKLDIFNKEQVNYLASNLRILSAMYGVLRPFDGIKNYRLDMNAKVLDMTNYQFWKEKINEESIELDVESKELVLNLSSEEFSKMLTFKYVKVDFKEKKEDDSYKIVGIYAKKARGKMVNYLILNRIETIDGVKKFIVDGYGYNEELSNDSNIVFTR
ncbi:MAG: YaaA family protein [Bacillota bacterium]|nr:YaaA family protein [Bacillota bacterium]